MVKNNKEDLRKSNGNYRMSNLIKKDKYGVNLNLNISQRLMDRIIIVKKASGRSICDIIRRVLYKAFLNEEI